MGGAPVGAFSPRLSMVCRRGAFRPAERGRRDRPLYYLIVGKPVDSAVGSAVRQKIVPHFHGDIREILLLFPMSLVAFGKLFARCQNRDSPCEAPVFRLQLPEKAPFAGCGQTLRQQAVNVFPAAVPLAGLRFGKIALQTAVFAGKSDHFLAKILKFSHAASSSFHLWDLFPYPSFQTLEF